MNNQTTSRFLVILSDMNEEDAFTPERIQELVKAHVDHIRDMDERGILFFCGALKDDGGGMLILSADTREEAETHVLRDPFIIHKAYRRFTIQEIIEANAGNNYLM